MSSLHSKLATPEPASVALNTNVADVLLVGLLGALSMLVVGPVVSTSQVKLAGVGSALVAASIARTWNVCEASVKLVYVLGEVQAANVPPSSLHSKLATPEPTSVPLKLNVAEELLLGFDGLPSMVVFGGMVSFTLSVREASVVAPQLSVARIVMLCEPKGVAPLIETTPAEFTLTVPV